MERLRRTMHFLVTHHPQRWLQACCLTLGLSQAASAANWSAAPRGLPHALDLTLTEPEAALLSRALIFPPAEAPTEQAFVEALVLEPVTIDYVLVGATGTAQLDSDKFQRAVAAFKDTEVFRVHPAIRAYDRQIVVVNELAARLALATSSERDGYAAELRLAKAQLEVYEGRLKVQAPDDILAGILRRVYRDLSVEGFDLPTMDVFLREWPVWMAKFANLDYLTMRLHLATGVSPRSRQVLAGINSRLPGFVMHYGEVQAMTVTVEPSLDQATLMARLTVEPDVNGGFDLVYRLNFAGASSLFGSSNQSVYLPFNLGGSAVGGDRQVELPSLRANLCLKTKVLSSELLSAAPCGV